MPQKKPSTGFMKKITIMINDDIHEGKVFIQKKCSLSEKRKNFIKKVNQYGKIKLAFKK